MTVCGLLALLWAIPVQAAPAFHFESVCRSDPATNKDIVTVVLHDAAADTGTIHASLVGATVNVLWYSRSSLDGNDDAKDIDLIEKRRCERGDLNPRRRSK